MTTHPIGGGGTGPGGGGGTGPGRISPLTAEQRVDNYRRQTGRTELTPAQRRRAAKKARRAAVRGLAQA